MKVIRVLIFVWAIGIVASLIALGLVALGLGEMLG